MFPLLLVHHCNNLLERLVCNIVCMDIFLPTKDRECLFTTTHQFLVAFFDGVCGAVVGFIAIIDVDILKACLITER